MVLASDFFSVVVSPLESWRDWQAVSGLSVPTRMRLIIEMIYDSKI
jgi:hypothetical protein